MPPSYHIPLLSHGTDKPPSSSVYLLQKEDNMTRIQTAAAILATALLAGCADKAEETAPAAEPAPAVEAAPAPAAAAPVATETPAADAAAAPATTDATVAPATTNTSTAK